jgi:FkbM family methyltransferase
MIINKDYVVSRINFLIKEKQKNIQAAAEKERELYAVKLGFPLWLRKIVFTPYNPVYAVWKERKRTNAHKNAIIYANLHIFAVDFIRYCFENDINFNTSDFFFPCDDMLIQEHIDNRIKSVLAGYDTVAMNKEQLNAYNAYQKISKLIKKDGKFHKLSYEGKQYYLSKKYFDINTFEYHYGLKNLSGKLTQYIAGKDFLDIGALYGEAGLVFLQYNPARIFAYEPVTSSYHDLLKTIEKNGVQNKIFAINKGIGDKEASMEITLQSSQSTLLKSGNQDGLVATEIVAITTIDEECKNKKIGLIKMDIEGFEYFAIKGGLETIKRDKPVLLISVYHTGKDFFEIPPMIKTCVSGYKFKYLNLAPHDFLSEKVVVGYVE